MKKLLCAVLFLMFTVIAFADQLSLTQTEGPYKWELEDTLGSAVRLVGTASDTLFNNIPVKNGYGYVLLVVDSLVADSVAIKTFTRIKKSGDIYGYHIADNISSADATNPYVALDLGVGTANGTAGSYFAVVATGLTATVQKKITRAALYRYTSFKRSATVRDDVNY